MTADPKPPTRFIYHAVWTVEAPEHPDGPRATMAQLDPIGPGIMRRVIEMTATRILADHGQHKVRVGAVSCTSEPDRPESRYQYRAPGPEQAKTRGGRAP